jgi:hypothetical protein
LDRILEFLENNLPKDSIIKAFKNCGIDLLPGEIKLLNSKLLSWTELEKYINSLTEIDLNLIQGIEEIYKDKVDDDFLVSELNSQRPESESSQESFEEYSDHTSENEDQILLVRRPLLNRKFRCRLTSS